MATFYYLAVANADNRKMTGQIDAQTIESARQELNKIGLSVLTISAEKPADYAKNNAKPDDSGNIKAFEFEATDRNGKDVGGTIDALDLENAYNRLTDEFNFQVACVYSANATEEEKAKAKKEGVSLILKMKVDREVAEAEDRKKTFKGSLQNLVRKAENKIESKFEESDHGTHQEKISSENEKSAPIQSDNLSVKSVKVVSKSGLEKITGQIEKFFAKLAKKDSASAEPISGQQSVSRSSHIRGLLNNFASPPAGKTRSEVWQELKKTFADGKNNPLQETGANKTIKPKFYSLLRKIWQWIGSLASTLAAIYLGYFILATLALQYDWGTFSELAQATVADTTLVPFLALTFLIISLLVLARDRISQHRLVLTPLILAFGGLLIFVTGVNFLY